MQKLSHQILSFSEFTLDLRRGCLLRAQEEIKLRPKSFEVLRYLVENNARLISKDELIHAVWVEAAVTDDSLVQCLKDIRHALSDETQQIIKTVHGRGYIFDTEVRDNGSAQVTKYTEETQGVQVIIEEQTDGREQHEIAAQTPPLLAAPKVSPVRRFTNAIKQHKLATAFSSAVFVALVIAGIVIVANGSEMLRKQYSWGGDFTDAFLTVQDEIAKGVAGKLPLSLSDAERQRLTRRYTQNPAAYDVYLKGRAAWFKTTPEGYRKSIEYYQQAIDLDPISRCPTGGWAPVMRSRERSA